MAEELLRCPFCGENGFDLVMLKGHLMQWCEVYPRTPMPDQEAAQRRTLKESNEDSE